MASHFWGSIVLGAKLKVFHEAKMTAVPGTKKGPGSSEGTGADWKEVYGSTRGMVA